jgi:hypothetical protein
MFERVHRVVEWFRQHKTEVLREKLDPFYFVHYKSHTERTCESVEIRSATNCLNRGTAILLLCETILYIQWFRSVQLCRDLEWEFRRRQHVTLKSLYPDTRPYNVIIRNTILPNFCVVLCIVYFVSYFVLYLCVYVYCTTATGWLPNCS